MFRISKIGTLSLILGYIFLYMPIIFLVFFSFISARIPGAGSGFTLMWYQKLFENEVILKAFFTSLKIASFAATIATVIGTCAALATVRYKNFKGRLLFSGMIQAPLVMPEVITGLSLLLMFVTLESFIGFPSKRGVLTVVIGHATLSLSYVYLIVRSRLLDFDYSLEEAAFDLGAKPFKVFITITLPLISKSLMTAWLLAFALSLDDVVLASFLSGPGATTLPILIFSNVRLGVTPEINALASMIVFATTTFIGLAMYLTMRTSKGLLAKH
jgi:putrescine transport system permease protein